MRVGRGEWREGEMIPGRRDLAKHYGVELATLQRAIGSLLVDGTLRADGGRGTFVGAGSVTKPGRVVPAKPTVRAEPLAPLCIITAPYPLNPWTETLITSMERTYAGAGGSLLYAYPRREDWLPTKLTDAAVDLIRNKQCQGAVALLLEDEDLDKNINGILNTVGAFDMPFVVVAYGPTTRPLYNVYYDNRDAGYQAAHHLIEQGCRTILFVKPCFPARWAEDRAIGARGALADAGLPTSNLQVVETPHVGHMGGAGAQAEYAAEYAAEWFTSDRLPHGVISANDHLGVALMDLADRRGIRAGSDFALVSFDDLPKAREAGLTSLRPPLEEIGQEAAAIIASSRYRNERPRRVCLHSQLVVRASSASFASSLIRY
jgi:DNA-binding LacI/PurR family transcriptional regulator